MRSERTGLVVSTTLSTPRLSEVAKHLFYPEGIVTSGWPRIRDRLAEMSIEFDTWQQGAAQIILGRDAAGRYVATIGGVTMSIPRQVGKTFTVGSLLIALCIEYPGLRVVWTSHHLRTTTNTFRAMQGMVRRPKVAHYLAHNGIRTANGEQEIRFGNGSIIMFGAREHGFGVGIDAIDILVCDEAQRLSSRALADMAPTTNQARHEHGALLFFIGTPPRPDNDGDEFAARRQKALDGRMSNGIYIEMGADEDGDFDDPEQWARANPSYPRRTPHESMLRLRENLTDPGDWRREAMGVWDDGAGIPPLIDSATWAALRVAEAPDGDRRALGVRFSLDGRTVAVAGAIAGAERVLVEGIKQDSTAGGIDGLVDWIATRWRRYGAVVVDGKAGAGMLLAALHKKGVPKRIAVGPTAGEFITAHSMFFDAVQSGRLAHSGQAGLTASVASGAQHLAARGWWWEPIGDGDTLLLEAATLALWGVESKAPATAAAPRRIY